MAHEWMPGPPGKYTGRYVAEQGPDRVQPVPTPPKPIGEYRDPASRLGWRFPIKRSWTAEWLAKTIELCSSRHSLFFVDTCFFTKPLEDIVWEALLERDIVITPLVLYELQPWLDNPKCNKMMRDEVKRAVNHSHPRIHINELDEVILRHGFSYYADLLTLRKLHGFIIANEFQKRNGRPPNKDEFNGLAFRAFGERGALIARKGWDDFGKHNCCADEELAVTAALSALISGNDVTILTRDHDILEQFYKLLFLIETHYKSMLSADRYASNPSAFLSMPIPNGDHFGDPFRRFVGGYDLLLESDSDPVLGWRDLLPEERRDVHLQCLWFSGGPSQLVFESLEFNADEDMRRLLEIKGRTGGMNTDMLDDRNCHAWAYPDNHNLGGLAAVAVDRKFKVHEGREHSVLDMIFALLCVERFELLEWRK